jgi:hypothetical protein
VTVVSKGTVHSWVSNNDCLEGVLASPFHPKCRKSFDKNTARGNELKRFQTDHCCERQWDRKTLVGHRVKITCVLASWAG